VFTYSSAVFPHVMIRALIDNIFSVIHGTCQHPKL
jgi:hypothetical protein